MNINDRQTMVTLVALTAQADTISEILRLRSAIAKWNIAHETLGVAMRYGRQDDIPVGFFEFETDAEAIHFKLKYL